MEYFYSNIIFKFPCFDVQRTKNKHTTKQTTDYLYNKDNKFLIFSRISCKKDNSLSIQTQNTCSITYIRQNSPILTIPDFKIINHIGSAYVENKSIKILDKIKKQYQEYKFDYLVIYMFDRLCRNIATFEQIISFLKQNNIKIISIIEPNIDITKPESLCLARQLICSAQLNSEKLSQRMLDMKRQRDEQGIKQTRKKVLIKKFGYDILNNNYIEKQQEIQVLNFIKLLLNSNKTETEINQQLKLIQTYYSNIEEFEDVIVGNLEEPCNLETILFIFNEYKILNKDWIKKEIKHIIKNICVEKIDDIKFDIDSNISNLDTKYN